MCASGLMSPDAGVSGSRCRAKTKHGYGDHPSWTGNSASPAPLEVGADELAAATSVAAELLVS